MMAKLVNALLFKPPEPVPYNFPSRVVRLRKYRGERIAATFLKREGATVTILFSHGNAEDLTTSYPFMKRLSRELNVNVVSYDYSGYGESTGKPNEKNCYADIDAVYRYVTRDLGIQPEQLVLYGRSLGSGPSCYLASRTSKQGRPVAGLILYSPFTSVYRVVVDMGFTVVGDKFSNIDRVSTLRCPVFIIHGCEDDVVPFDHGRELYEALPANCKTKPYWVKGMGHNNPGCRVEAAIMERTNRFLDDYVLSKLSWSPPPSPKARSTCSSSTEESTQDDVETIPYRPPIRAYM